MTERFTFLRKAWGVLVAIIDFVFLLEVLSNPPPILKVLFLVVGEYASIIYDALIFALLVLLCLFCLQIGVQHANSPLIKKLLRVTKVPESKPEVLPKPSGIPEAAQISPIQPTVDWTLSAEGHGSKALSDLFSDKVPPAIREANKSELMVAGQEAAMLIVGFRTLLGDNVRRAKSQLDKDALGRNRIQLAFWDRTPVEMKRKYVGDDDLYKALESFSTALKKRNERINLPLKVTTDFHIYHNACLVQYEVLTSMDAFKEKF
jgi:hypothetical protein